MEYLDGTVDMQRQGIDLAWFPAQAFWAAGRGDKMDRSNRNSRRSVRFQPWNEVLERKQLLSGSSWPPYVSNAELYSLLHDPVGYPAVRPNTPVLPFGTAAKLATYIDPTAHIINGHAVIVGAPSFIAPYATLNAHGGIIKIGSGTVIQDNSAIVANPLHPHTAPAPQVSIGDHVLVLYGAQILGPSTIGAYASAEVFNENEYSILSEPMDMYPGWAKRMAELQCEAYLKQYGQQYYSVVRPCNVYGPGDNFDPDNAMVIPTLMSRIANGDKPVRIWGDGAAVRDFLYSRDAAEGCILALYHGTRGSFVNLGSGKGYTIRKLVESLREFLEFEYEFDVSKPAGYPRRIMDAKRAKDWIGFEASTTLIEGLKKTWAWFMENRQEYLGRKNYWKDA